MQVNLTVPTVSEFVAWCQQWDFVLPNGVILYLVLSYIAVTVVTVWWRLGWLDEQKERCLSGLYEEDPGDFWIPATIGWLLAPLTFFVLLPSFVIMTCSAPFIWWRNRLNG